MQSVTPKFSETQGAVRHPGPALGEHNDYVWGEVVGKSVDEMANLKDPELYNGTWTADAEKREQLNVCATGVAISSLYRGGWAY